MNDKMDNKQTHEVLLQMLKEFKKVCTQNNIWYSLAYGSVLGAVRHNGFIPWDGDADVFILLPDKERFREAFAKEDHGNITLKNHEMTERCTQSHDTLIYKNNGVHVHLDIYPLVGAPSTKKEQARFTFWSYYLDSIFRSKYVTLKKCKPKNKPLVLAAKIVTALIPARCIKNFIKRQENRVAFDKAEYLINLACYKRADACIPKGVMLDVFEHEFEGEMFNIPANYDEYLRRTFGRDYMTPKVY